MGEARELLASLAQPTSRKVDRAIFARDNLLNSHERLRPDTPLHIIFGRIVRVEFPLTKPEPGAEDESPIDELAAYLEVLDESYVAGKRKAAAFDHDSHIEKLLEAFDQFIFDTRGVELALLPEQVADFGRVAVLAASSQIPGNPPKAA